MTDIKQTVALDFQSNVKELSSDVITLKRQILELGEQQKQLNKDFKDGLITQEEYAAGLLASEKQMKDYNKRLKDSQDKLEELKNKNKGFKGALQDVEKEVDKMTGGFLSSFKKLATNPYFAAISIALTAIVGAFNKLRDAIKNSDNAGTAFARLGAVLKAPLELVNKLVDTLANGLGKLADGFSRFMQSLMPEGIREEADAMAELVERTDALEEAERQYTVHHAERVAEQKKLNTIIRDSVGQTAEARAKAVRDNLQLEQEDINERRRNVQEKIDLLKLEHRNQQSWSDDVKQEYSNLVAEMIGINDSYNDALAQSTRYMKQISSDQIEEWAKMSDGADGYRKKIQEVVQAQSESRTNAANIFIEESKKESEAFDEIINQTANVVKDLDKKLANLKTSDQTELVKKGIQNVNRAIDENTKKLNTLKGARDAANSGDETALTNYLIEIKRLNYLGEEYDEFKNYLLQTARAYNDINTAQEKQKKDEEELNKKVSDKKIEEAKKAWEKESSRLEAENGARIALMEEGAEKEKEIIREDNRKKLRDLDYQLKYEGMSREEYNNRKIILEKETEKKITDVIVKEEDKRAKKLAKEREEEEKKRKEEEKNRAEATKQRQIQNYRDAQSAYMQLSAQYKLISKQLNDEYNDALSEGTLDGTRKAQQALDKLSDEYKYRQIELTDSIQEIWNKVQLGELTEEQANNMVKVFEAALLQLGVDMETLKKMTKDAENATHDITIKLTQDIVSSVSSTFEALGTVFDYMATAYEDKLNKMLEDSESFDKSQTEQALDLAESQYHATIAGIILNQAAALGNVVVGALGAFANQPGGIAAKIAALAAATTAGLSAVFSGIQQAKVAADTYNEQKKKIEEKSKYATGGYVEGAGTTTSDSIPARLSNGEAVINAKSTSMYYDLLSKINQAGGGVAFPNAQNTPILRFASGGVANSTATIVEAVKTAVKDIQPVVSVKEITRVQNKLKAKEI